MSEHAFDSGTAVRIECVEGASATGRLGHVDIRLEVRNETLFVELSDTDQRLRLNLINSSLVQVLTCLPSGRWDVEAWPWQFAEVRHKD